MVFLGLSSTSDQTLVLDAGEIKHQSAVNSTENPGDYSSVVISKIDKKKADPFDVITLSGSGFTTTDDMLVTFSQGKTYEVNVRPIEATASSLVVPVPYYFNSASGKIGKGKVTIWVETISQSAKSNSIKKFTINALPKSKENAGELTEQFLVDLDILSQLAQTQLSVVQSETNGAVKTAKTQKKLKKMQESLAVLNKDIEKIRKGLNSSFPIAKTSTGSVMVDINVLSLSDQLTLAHLNQMQKIIRKIGSHPDFEIEAKKGEIPSLLDIYFSLLNYAEEESFSVESAIDFGSYLDQFQKISVGAALIASGIFDALEREEPDTNHPLTPMLGAIVMVFLNSYAEGVITYATNHYFCAVSNTNSCVRVDVGGHSFDLTSGDSIIDSLLKGGKDITVPGVETGWDIWRLGEQYFLPENRAILSSIILPNIAGSWSGNASLPVEDGRVSFILEISQNGKYFFGTLYSDEDLSDSSSQIRLSTVAQLSGFVHPLSVSPNIIFTARPFTFYVYIGNDQDFPCPCYAKFWGSNQGSTLIEGRVRLACWGDSDCPDVYGTFDLIEQGKEEKPSITSFKIMSGEEGTESRKVPLNNSCEGNPTHYMASEDAQFRNASWRTYSDHPSFTLSNGYGWKTVYFKVKNNAGESKVKSDRIEYVVREDKPDITSFKINNGEEATTTRKVTLNNSCDGNPTHYMASEDPELRNATSWRTYSPWASFTLSKGYGRKIVYFKVKNDAGESNVKSDRIEYVVKEEKPSITSFKISGGAYTTRNRTVELMCECDGNPTHYMASEDAEFGNASWKTYSFYHPIFTLSNGYGRKIVYFKVKNNAGESKVESDTIKYIPKDDKAYIVSFLINNGAEDTTTRKVTLNNSCAWNTHDGKPTHYMASEDAEFKNATRWRTYSTHPNFTLSNEYGRKRVYLKVKSNLGESKVKSDSILFKEESGIKSGVNIFPNREHPFGDYDEWGFDFSKEKLIPIGDEWNPGNAEAKDAKKKLAGLKGQ